MGRLCGFDNGTHLGIVRERPGRPAFTAAEGEVRARSGLVPHVDRLRDDLPLDGRDALSGATAIDMTTRDSPHSPCLPREGTGNDGKRCVSLRSRCAAQSSHNALTSTSDRTLDAQVRVRVPGGPRSNVVIPGDGWRFRRQLIHLPVPASASVDRAPAPAQAPRPVRPLERERPMQLRQMEQMDVIGGVLRKTPPS
jgi:hypothetical protein